MKKLTLAAPLAPLIALIACGSSGDGGDDPVSEEPAYIEACAATEIEGPDPITEVSWAFERDGARFVETASNGEGWTWEFNDRRRYTLLSFEEAGSVAYLELHDYDGDNLLSSSVDIDGDGEDLPSITRHTYDGDLRLETTRDDDSDQTIDSRTSYLYDDSDNEVRREVDLGDDGSVDQVESRSYEGDLLVAIERDSDNDGAVDERTVVTYDAAGDVTSFEVTDAEGVSLRSLTLTRDDRGNVLERRDERPDFTVVSTGTFDERDRMLTSGLSIDVGGFLSTSDFSYRYECP